MAHTRFSQFFSMLQDPPALSHVFYPWSMVDEQNDADSEAPKVRMRHLRHYMEVRKEKCKYILVGEAVGYQGGHFSGIPMTSERILLGYQRDRGIHPEDVLPGLRPRRTSSPERMKKGFTEPTATIVWEAIVKSPCSPQSVVLWNAFPWHPYEEHKGLLSNRKPTVHEMEAGLDILRVFVGLFDSRIIAVGRVAERWLKEVGMRCRSVRHPAQGGGQTFRSQISRILREGHTASR